MPFFLWSLHKKHVSTSFGSSVTLDVVDEDAVVEAWSEVADLVVVAVVDLAVVVVDVL